jgi:hypothetical protein
MSGGTGEIKLGFNLGRYRRLPLTACSHRLLIAEKILVHLSQNRSRRSQLNRRFYFETSLSRKDDWPRKFFSVKVADDFL